MQRAGLDPALAKSMYGALARGIVELLAASALPPDAHGELASTVTLEPALVAAIDTALARGPLVLLASHTGNWELAAGAAGRILAARGRRLVIVAKRQSASGVDAFIMRLRERLGVRVVVADAGVLAACRAAFASGDVVVLPIDQVPDRSAHALSMTFLGEHALVDRAPATLAFRAGATALVLATERLADGEQLVRLLGALPPVAGARSAQWIADTTTTATRVLDAFILARPSGWLWTHRRWRRPRREILSSSASQVTSAR